MKPYGEAQNKAMRAYIQSGQYHTIVKRSVIPNLLLTSNNHLEEANGHMIIMQLQL